MDEPVKRSEVQEREYTQAVLLGIVGILCLGGTFIFWKYGGMFTSLAFIFGLAWLGLWGFAGWRLYQLRSLESHAITCPFCNQETAFLSSPTSDFTCEHCLKRVPMENGRVLEVVAVKCPHCGSLEQVSARASVAICEQCNREIMITRVARSDVSPLAHAPLAQDDPTPYELLLIHPGKHPEDVIHLLQSLLTLNRPDVKKILDALPTVILTNLPRRKGEGLMRQFTDLGAQVDLRPIDNENRVPSPWV